MKLTHILAAAFAALFGTAMAPTVVCAAPATMPFLDPLFANNMVLQRGQSDPVWGWTDAGSTVTVKIAGQSASAVANSDGKWSAMLPALPAGGPYTMSVSGPESVSVQNVLVGDVWICSGQSNMEFGMANLTTSAQTINAANYPKIRVLQVEDNLAASPQSVAAGQWEECTPNTTRTDGLGGFSAVDYFFARNLYLDQHVPIGIISASWGGTPLETWASESVVKADLPDFAAQLAELDAYQAGPQAEADRRPEIVKQWYTENDPGSQGDLGWADPGFDDSSWESMPLPGYFQQAGVPSLVGVNGIMWYRRTFDVPAEDAGKSFDLMLKADDNDTTWINGQQIGATEGYDAQRDYPIPASLLKPTGNVIAVRLLDTGGNGGIYGDASALCLKSADGATIPLAGSWRYNLSVELQKTRPYLVAINNNANLPSALFNGMINPLIPYGVKGMIWEPSGLNADRAYQYRDLMPGMISDWRARWNQPNLPIVMVEAPAAAVPPAQPGDDPGAELREVQQLTAAKVPNCALATLVDTGDPDNAYTKNKQEAARRIALVTRGLAYHESVGDLGPVFQSASLTGSSLIVQLTHTDGGLVTEDSRAPSGFAIAGSDQKWHWATARIDGNTVVVSSPDVPDPVAVRYSWTAGPVGNIASRNGMPLFPFRSDDFPLSKTPHDRSH